MASSFLVYLRLGFGHIVDAGAWDHILFIVALSAGYALGHWRELLVLVTAFTVGHSVTLALATFRLLSVDGALVEVLIPVTILVTALFGVWEMGGRDEDGARHGNGARRARYGLALGFGLIHGLGFSTFLRAVLGAEESISLPLFAFNVGLEAGQVVILGILLLLSHAAVRWTPLGDSRWALFLSGTTAVAALALLVQRVSG